MSYDKRVLNLPVNRFLARAIKFSQVITITLQSPTHSRQRKPEVGWSFCVCPLYTVYTCSYFSVKPNKLPRIAFSPGWQTDITDDVTVLLGAEFKLVVVREEFWEVEELWNQLFDVRHVGLGRGQPSVFHRVK